MGGREGREMDNPTGCLQMVLTIQSGQRVCDYNKGRYVCLWVYALEAINMKHEQLIKKLYCILIYSTYHHCF